MPLFKQGLGQGLRWLRHWLYALDAHSLHSPFLFQLHCQVLRGLPPANPAAATYAPGHVTAQTPPQGPAIEQLRARLRASTAYLEVTDLGAGSQVMKGTRRGVAQIAKYSSTPPAFSALLYRLATFMGYQHLLEAGTSLGLNTLYMAAVPGAQVHTLEGCPQTAQQAQQNFGTLPALQQRITQWQGHAHQTMPQALAAMPTLDLAYLDANHTYEATMHYAQLCMQKWQPMGCLVVDDIHWSSGMARAWQELKQQVACSIDLFEAGLLFGPAVPAQGHFVLRA